jgi:hypothetical protein
LRSIALVKFDFSDMQILKTDLALQRESRGQRGRGA